jgi:putative membrane protein
MSQNLSGGLATTVTEMCSAFAEAGVNYGVKKALEVFAQELSAFAPKITQLKDAVAKLAAGASSLNVGLGTLADGTGALSRGADQLAAGTSALAGGAGQLTEGGEKLVDGMDTLSGGVDQLINAVKKGEVKLDDLIAKMNSIREAGQAYNNYSGVADGMTCNVKYVIKTDGVSAE